MAIDYPDDFGPESASEPGKDIKDIDTSEYEEYQKELEAQKAKMRNGSERINETIKQRPTRLSQRREQSHNKRQDASPTPGVTLACRVCM